MSKLFLQIKEAIYLTFGFLLASKLRSLLSVLGVTIGIFCIVAVLTATYSMEVNIRSNIDKLGDKIVYIQKWPWGFGGDYHWWDYMNRPETTPNEYKQLTKDANKEIIKQTAFLFDFGDNKISSPVEDINDVKIQAVMGDFFDITQWQIYTGRSFNGLEKDHGNNVAILGYALAVNLFKGSNPVGQSVKINGIKVDVIGVLEPNGSSVGGPNYDDNIILPGNFALRFARPNRRGVGSAIVINGYENVDMDYLEFEITRIMRSLRKLHPKEQDNFAINKLTMFSDGLSQTFGVINLVAWLIGGFSLLVGGFGIANIMFVSVKERTSIIGLQKALGAKRSFILTQFIFESIFLCIVGAAIGILTVVLLGYAITATTDFTIYQSSGIILTGVSISIIIGVVAGLAPAYMAARMDPVTALRK